MFIFNYIFYCISVGIKIQKVEIKMFSIFGVTFVLYMSLFSDNLLRGFRS